MARCGVVPPASDHAKLAEIERKRPSSRPCGQDSPEAAKNGTEGDVAVQSCVQHEHFEIDAFPGEADAFDLKAGVGQRAAHRTAAEQDDVFDEQVRPAAAQETGAETGTVGGDHEQDAAWLEQAVHRGQSGAGRVNVFDDIEQDNRVEVIVWQAGVRGGGAGIAVGAYRNATGGIAVNTGLSW
ncbi:MAG: hypothetical protein JXA69_20835 [Phycisphaerae bacterium]|nr:hypothetical protein [Phycisphaerae bacterium]